MASFRKEIEGMSLDTYDSVVLLFKLLNMLSQKLDLSKPQVNGRFQFGLGKITCICESFEEFVENAYGAENFYLVSTQFQIIDEKSTVIYVSSIGGNTVVACADSRVMLEKFFAELEELQSSVQNPTNSITQNIIDSVVINGDRNAVANNNGSVEVEMKQEASKVKSFWTGILQNITSNLLWYILTLAAGALVAYFAMK